MLPLQRVRVRSLVGELRSLMPHSVAKKKKKDKRLTMLVLARMWRNWNVICYWWKVKWCSHFGKHLGGFL